MQTVTVNDETTKYAVVVFAMVLNQSNNIKIHRHKMAATTQQYEYVEDCMVESNFLDTVQYSTQGIGDTASY